ncbi:hypothetical protein HLB23_21135 [Nocardia uniformis]|uniref:Uncharacterized protein n=1 Tax=Nocardia uniformis TaxID=53432 RepID=A0A849C0S0_9NOCA|nr:hypothetical protein [Nocardia uniformis]NNH72332.1 hypothetical protein [Nocardia uniformis]
MSGWNLTRAHVTAWRTSQLASLATTLTTGNSTFSHQVDRLPKHLADVGTAWVGRAHDAAYDRVIEDHRQARKIWEETNDLVTVLGEAADRLYWERDNLLRKVADAEAPDAAGAGTAMKVEDNWSITFTIADTVPADQHADLRRAAQDHQNLIAKALTELRNAAHQVDRLIREAAWQIRWAGNHFGDGIDAPTINGTADPGDAVYQRQPDLGPDGYSEERTQAAAVAFKELFGRPPTTPTDWQTAHVLNPHSYTPKFQGVAPAIQVVKIEPVRGQGVVRAAQYIEQRDVTSWPPPRRDLGDNRTADPQFDPEHAKVTTYIDYENGIVVMRQNPSVRQNADGSAGEVQVSAPVGEVWQTDSGSVRIKYDAGNPFAPDWTADPPLDTKFDDHPVTVNGDLVFIPSESGVEVHGVRTDYPSLEVYQDDPQGNTRTVVTDPAVTGRSWGPSVNLPLHHEIGLGELAFRPFHEWNNTYDVPGPAKQSTPFGPTANPPRVPLPEGTI